MICISAFVGACFFAICVSNKVSDMQLQPFHAHTHDAWVRGKAWKGY